MSVSSAQLDDETLQRLYTWVDEIPLSRPKRNIARDFSDAGTLPGWVFYPFLVPYTKGVLWIVSLFGILPSAFETFDSVGCRR